MEFEPTMMMQLANWLLNNAVVFGAGMLLGSVSTGVVLLLKLRRTGVL